MPSCRHCGHEVQDNEMFCPACGVFDDYPNVKMARAERAGLQERFLALDDAIRKDPVLVDVASNTEAVVNVSLDYAAFFLRSAVGSYATYRKQVEAGIRKPASPPDDQERTGTEGDLFGSGSSVFYAVLAGPKQGLSSYGSVALRLKENCVEKRASLLEENSYVVRKSLPNAARATWDDRVMLAIAKLGAASDRTRESLRRALLFCEGHRKTDKFIEVHVWGGFTPDAIGSIELQLQPCNDEEKLLAQLAAKAADRRNIPWVTL